MLTHSNFPPPPGPYSQVSSTQLKLSNTSSTWIVFKVKTIQPRSYVVKPTNGIIAPGKDLTVTVELQPIKDEMMDKFKNSKQKFMVQYRGFSQEPTGSALNLVSSSNIAGTRHSKPLLFLSDERQRCKPTCGGNQVYLSLRWNFGRERFVQVSQNWRASSWSFEIPSGRHSGGQQLQLFHRRN